MPRWTPMQLVGGSYADDAKPWTQQDTINYIPVPAEKEGVRSSAILRGLPGYTAFCDLGTNAPIRGARNVEGALFVVSAQTLFKVNANGTATALGTIPGASRCSLTHNQVAGGNQVAISNGQSGYVYNTATSTLSQITDEGFPGAICFNSVDSYILGIEPSRRFAFTSDLADATSYNTLDQYEAEGAPDLLVGQAVTHRDWWLMGERTIEPFSNTGAATGTFQRIDGTVIEVGLAAPHAVAVMDNSVFWLGSDNIPYRANGYIPQRISTHAIEQAIARCDTSKAFAFTFEDRGHKVFYLTFPDGHTWGYDAATGEWHRRKSHDLDRWRINTLTKWNGRWIAGDFSNGKLYQLDWDMQHEDGLPLERRRITGVTHDNQNALIINGLALVVDTGVKTFMGPPPVISGNLPDTSVGSVISYAYTVSGGKPAYVVAVTSGALPTGLTINASGVISGTTTATGTFVWTVQVTDAYGDTASLADECVVSEAASAWLVTGYTTGANAKTAVGSTGLSWQTPATAAVNAKLYAYRAPSGTLYVSGQGSGYVATSPEGASWTSTGTTTSVSAGGGRLAFSGIYQLIAGGVQLIGRRSTGTWANPTASNTSRANTLVVYGSTLVAASIYANQASISTDNGVTWAYGSGSFTATGSSASPILATNGSRIVIVYDDGTAGFNVHIKYSDNGGQSWSAAAFTFANPSSSNPGTTLLWTGTRFIASTASGQVAYSSDGSNWTLSGSTIGSATQMGAGLGRVMAACGSSLYYSADDGATWAPKPLPTGLTAANGVAWILPPDGGA